MAVRLPLGEVTPEAAMEAEAERASASLTAELQTKRAWSAAAAGLDDGEAGLDDGGCGVRRRERGNGEKLERGVDLRRQDFTGGL